MNVEIDADVLAVLCSAALKGSFGWPDNELRHALTVADDLIRGADVKKTKAEMIREEEDRALARQAASILGSRKSAKKAAASRANGRLGGRPPKAALDTVGKSLAKGHQKRARTD